MALEIQGTVVDPVQSESLAPAPLGGVRAVASSVAAAGGAVGTDHRDWVRDMSMVTAVCALALVVARIRRTRIGGR